MTRQLIFIFALFCSVQTWANSRYEQEDTVRYTSHFTAAELLQPLQPAYLDGVVLPMSWSGNWFVSLAGGTTAFLGTPLGCEDLFGRLKPSYSLAVGKWFTPFAGARINYRGLQFKDARLSTQDYHHIHADLLWNVLGRGYARQQQVRWNLTPFVGVGLLHNATNGHNPFALSYGIQGQYHISKRISTFLELSGTTTFQYFDGYGKSDRLGDNMLSLSAGFTFHLGKTGWKRAVDATPYIRQNEWLTDYVNVLSEENNRYKGRLDKSKRTLLELQKILEIEGLLDKYSHLFDSGDTIYMYNGYPKNNYSGLNSLRARLKNRHWDGKSVFDMQETYGNTDSGILLTDSLTANAQSSDIRTSATRPTAPKNMAWPLGIARNECIGSPVYFFFSLNSAHLTDASQMLNLDELARVAKKYGLSVRVTGAADNSTGTTDINDSLSVSRAAYIATELERRGIPTDCITQASKGGIADYVPMEANRHTKVELLLKKSGAVSE